MFDVELNPEGTGKSSRDESPGIDGAYLVPCGCDQIDSANAGPSGESLKLIAITGLRIISMSHPAA